ncbi:MAG: RDD family protein [Fluviicola sp.]
MNRIDNSGIRLVNYVIDIVIITIASTVINAITRYQFSVLVHGLLFFAYYLILESVLGQTIGKMVTGTRVVDQNKQTPSFGRILFRTLLRLNPLDVISYLFSKNGQGTHDVVSKTFLIKKENVHDAA